MAEWRGALTLCRDDLLTQSVIVAESEGHAVGFCAVMRSGSSWSLEHMWVLPMFMGRGVGKSLLQAAIDEVRAENGKTLTVESDPNAAGFYTRMGAQPVGRIPAPVAGTERHLPVFQLII